MAGGKTYLSRLLMAEFADQWAGTDEGKIMSSSREFGSLELHNWFQSTNISIVFCIAMLSETKLLEREADLSCAAYNVEW